MPRALSCDFFLDEVAPPDGVEEGADSPWLKVFPGPRGIVIADALLCVPGGRRVQRGEAIATRDGIDLVCWSVSDPGADPHAVSVRFVVKDAYYDPGVRYAIHNALAGCASA